MKLRVLSLLTYVYGNDISAIAALARIDSKHKLENSTFKHLAGNILLGRRVGRALELDKVITSSELLTPSQRESVNENLLKDYMRRVRLKSPTSLLQGILILSLSCIIMLPVPVMLLGFFYNQVMVLFPLIASLCYGIFLQVSVLALKRYIGILI